MRAPTPRPWAGLLLRYGVAGVGNTAVGLSVILVLDLGLRIPPAAANALGYVAGVASGFLLSRFFVFRTGRGGSTGLRYVLAVALAFAANQLALLVVGAVTPDAPLWRAAAQVSGLVTYTVLLFVLSALWVFRERPAR